MKEHPIIFSTEMVKSILEGRKTMTRRVIKPQPNKPEGTAHDWEWKPAGMLCYDDYFRSHAVNYCPYGQVGDGLWVRETTWVSDCGKYHCYLDAMTEMVVGENIRYTNVQGDRYRNYGFSCLSVPDPRRKDYAFKKYFGEVDLTRDPWADMDFEKTRIEANFHKKTPSIHMPRWASRITLGITAIRVERLQEIRDADCVAEGCPHALIMLPTVPMQEWFKHLWDSLNAKRGYSWESNPFVWVIEFKRQIPIEETPERLEGIGYVPKCLDLNSSRLIHSHRAFFALGGGSNVQDLICISSTHSKLNKGGRSREIPAYTGGHR